MTENKLIIGTAPDSWGVWFPDDPKQTPWERFLDEVAESGYKWIELGPYGYLPTDPARLAEELKARDLQDLGRHRVHRLPPRPGPVGNRVGAGPQGRRTHRRDGRGAHRGHPRDVARRRHRRGRGKRRAHRKGLGRPLRRAQPPRQDPAGGLRPEAAVPLPRRLPRRRAGGHRDPARRHGRPVPQPVPGHRARRVLRCLQPGADQELPGPDRLPAPQADQPGHPQKGQRGEHDLGRRQPGRRHDRTAERPAGPARRHRGRRGAEPADLWHRGTGHVPRGLRRARCRSPSAPATTCSPAAPAPPSTRRQPERRQEP